MFGASLGDRFGRRRLFAIGLAIFSTASAAAALAPGMGELIAARAAQGVGSAIVTPLTLTLLSAAVPAARRGTALGIWGAASGIAVATGPLIGGALTENLSWRWIFWVNVPLGLALIPLALLRLNESHGPNPTLDLVGTALASGGLFGIVYALVRGNADGWTSTPVLGGFIAGTALLVGFVFYELRAEHPMLPMRSVPPSFLQRHQRRQPADGAGHVRVDLPAQPVPADRRRLLPDASRRTDAALTAMPMIAGPLAGALSDRIGGAPVVTAGMTLNAVGLGLWALTVEPHVAYTHLLPALIVCGIGLGMFFAPSANLVMSTVRPEEQGIASGANNAIREIGVASLAAVFSAQGGYGSASLFVDGLIPALWVGAGAVALAAAVALLMPRQRKADGPAAGLALGSAPAGAPAAT